MKKKALLPLLLGNGLLAGCDYSKSSNRDGFFYNTSVEPMSKVLHWLAIQYLTMTTVLQLSY